MSLATPTAGPISLLGFWLLLFCLGYCVSLGYCPALKSPRAQVLRCHMGLFLQETKMQPQNREDPVGPKPSGPLLPHSSLGAGTGSRSVCPELV